MELEVLKSKMDQAHYIYDDTLATVLAVALPVALIFGMTAFDADVSFVWLLPVLTVAVLILVYSGWRKRDAVAPVVMSWLVSYNIRCIENIKGIFICQIELILEK